MRSVLLVFLLSFGIFAGCLDDSDDSFISARDGLGMARAAAQRWNSDAVLYGAMTFEVGDAVRQEIAEDLAQAREELDEEEQECRDDGDSAQECAEMRDEAEKEITVMAAVVDAGSDRVGDGKGAIWIYAFYSDEADAGFYAVANARKVLLSEEAGGAIDFDVGSEMPITEWPVDSDDAATAARQGDEDFAELATRPNATAYSILVQGPEQPYWILGIQDDDSNDEVTLAVDAVNATVVSLDDLFGALVLLQEWGWESGSMSAGAGVSEGMSFEVEATSHQAMAVRVTLTPMPPPAAPIEVTVTDPLGVEASFTLTFCAGCGSATTVADEVLLSPAPAGTYQVRLDAPLVVRQDWTISWCTDGLPTAVPDFPGGQPGFPAFFDLPCESVPNDPYAESAHPSGPRWLRALRA